MKKSKLPTNAVSALIVSYQNLHTIPDYTEAMGKLLFTVADAKWSDTGRLVSNDIRLAEQKDRTAIAMPFHVDSVPVEFILKHFNDSHVLQELPPHMEIDTRQMLIPFFEALKDALEEKAEDIKNGNCESTLAVWEQCQVFCGRLLYKLKTSSTT